MVRVFDVFGPYNCWIAAMSAGPSFTGKTWKPSFTWKTWRRIPQVAKELPNFQKLWNISQIFGIIFQWRKIYSLLNIFKTFTSLSSIVGPISAVESLGENDNEDDCAMMMKTMILILLMAKWIKRWHCFHCTGLMDLDFSWIKTIKR